MTEYNTLCADVETGGFNPLINGLCSLAVSTTDKKHKKFWYFKPNKAKVYEEQAFKVNGLSLEFLEKNGKSEKEVVQEFYEFFGEHFKKNTDSKNVSQKYNKTIQGQNVSFDIGFLKVLFGEQIYSYFFNYHYKDTMIVAGFLRDCGFLPSNLKLNLVSLHEYFFPLSKLREKAHTCDTDVEMCIDVYDELIKLTKKKNENK